MIRFGYKAAAEQFGPVELLAAAVGAERAGFDSVFVSDHYQPWRHDGGHAPHAPVWLGALGQRTDRVLMGTSVLAPTFRHHPALVAQAFATLDLLAPGRLVLGIGSGESMNETPVLGIEWPGFRERTERLAEAVALMRRLWTEERVSFDGRWYQTRDLTLYDRPASPIPCYLAASGPTAARLAGAIGEGFICTSLQPLDRLRDELLPAVAAGAEGAGRDPGALERLVEIKVSFDADHAAAVDATRFWAALVLPGDAKHGVADPVEMQRRAEEVLDDAPSAWLVTCDPEEVAERVEPYLALGFSHLVFHSPSPDQAAFVDRFASLVLPRLRASAGG